YPAGGGQYSFSRSACGNAAARRGFRANREERPKITVILKLMRDDKTLGITHMATANDQSLDVIFRNARTHSAWLDKPVDESLLKQIHDLAILGPTSANILPMRIVYVK